MDLPAIGSFLLGREKRAKSDAARAEFEAAYREHFAFVWRSLLRLGVEPTEVEDAVQEVFLTAFRRWSDFEGRSALRTWLFGVARRVASHHRRGTQRRHRRHHAFSKVASTSVDGEALVAEQDAAGQLRAFLEQLDEPKRVVFVLADLEGFSGREVAQALGIKPNTAWSRLRAARAEFTRTFGTSVGKRPSVVVEDRPSAAAQARVWAVLMPQLPVAKAAVASGTAASLHAWVLGANLKVFAATVGTGTLAVGTAAVVMPPPSASAATPEVRAKSERSVASPKDASMVAVASVVSGVPSPTPPVVQTPTALEAPEEAKVEVQRPSAPRVAPAANTEDAPEPPEEPAPPEEELESNSPPPDSAELQLIHQARSYLDGGRPTMALIALARHKRDYPNGSLVRLRNVTHAEALCASNRRAKGIGVAYKLVRKDRDPQLVERLKKACGLKSFSKEDVERAKREFEAQVNKQPREVTPSSEAPPPPEVGV